MSVRCLILLAALSLVPASLAGCAQAVLLGYLIGGPPSIEPDFDLMTNESLSAKDMVVAVVCYAPTELKWDFENIDDEIAAALSYRLGEHHIKVIDPDYIRDWLDKHPDWEKPEEIGEAFHANYVIDIELTRFSLYEENSTTLYRGRTEAYVNVVKMDETGGGTRIYSKEIDSIFPTRAPRSTEELSYISFKRTYLSRLSEEMGWLFYERYNGDMIPWAT